MNHTQIFRQKLSFMTLITNTNFIFKSSLVFVPTWGKMLVPYCTTKRQKNHCFNMVRLKKISIAESRGSSRFSITKWCQILILTTFWKNDCSATWLQYFQGKIFIWANSVIIHSLKNIFKVPGGNWLTVFSSSNEECKPRLKNQSGDYFYIKLGIFEVWNDHKLKS